MRNPMRALARLVLAGTLIGSCSWPDHPGPLAPCSMAGDTVFDLYPSDSVRLVVGAMTWANVDWRVETCDAPAFLGYQTIDWEVRDPSVVGLGGPEPSRDLFGLRPGRSTIVVSAEGFLDSVVVIVPDTVPMHAVAAIAAGEQVSCAVELGGRALCWGEGSNLLGDPYTSPAVGICRGGPCSPMPVPRAEGMAALTVGAGHACGSDMAGKARCWGRNDTGQLGNPSLMATLWEPVPVSGSHAFTQLAAGSGYTCGIDIDAIGYCWGDTSVGKLGIGPHRGLTPQPTRVDGDHRLVSITAFGETSCAADEDGGILCWGAFGTSSAGTPPAGATTCEVPTKGGYYPVACAVSPLRMRLAANSGSVSDTSFVEVSGPCALASGGSVYCLDVDTGTYAPLTGIGPMVALAAAQGRGCALDADGSGWCWGVRAGDGTDSPRDTPVRVAGGHVFTQLAVGGSHACGLTPARDVWCWGYNFSGEVGVPLADDSSVPRRVRGQE